MKRLATFVFALLSATPAFAQNRPLDVRVFVLGADERFAAQQTFKAAFDSTTEPLWGGGVDVVIKRKFFVDLAVTQMRKSGQRFYADNTGVYPLGIASSVMVTPVEVSGGYRWRRRRHMIPYAGIGIGWYHYQEESAFSAPGDNVALWHAGLLATAGVELRMARWFGIAGEAHYSHVPGILGQTTVTSGSQVFGEDDLGGIAARVRFIFGR